MFLNDWAHVYRAGNGKTGKDHVNNNDHHGQLVNDLIWMHRCVTYEMFLAFSKLVLNKWRVTLGEGRFADWIELVYMAGGIRRIPADASIAPSFPPSWQRGLITRTKAKAAYGSTLLVYCRLHLWNAGFDKWFYAAANRPGVTPLNNACERYHLKCSNGTNLKKNCKYPIGRVRIFAILLTPFSCTIVNLL